MGVFVQKISRIIVLALFIFSNVASPDYVRAQSLTPVPSAQLLSLSPFFSPANVRGLAVYPNDPLKFDFIINAGDDNLSGPEFKKESEKLIKYFLTALTVPEKELWVNLSPYEKDRMIPEGLGGTRMGIDMLGQDRLLKQMTASLMSPDSELGKKFWNRVYEKAHEKFGIAGADIPVDTFNKVWIAPDKAVVYEQGSRVFIAERHLRVLLESDYLATSKATQGDTPTPNVQGDITREVVRSIIIPELEKEVNSGKNFAPLRQIYNALILASWYKKRLHDSILGQVYAGANKTRGVATDDRSAKERIYAQYLETFRKGVFNLIREEYDPALQETVPRKYFSGGLAVGAASVNELQVLTGDAAQLPSEMRDFILHSGSQGKDAKVTWQAVENLASTDAAQDPALTILDRREVMPFQPINPVADFEAREFPDIQVADRKAGIPLFIDISDDLKTVTYYEVLDDSKVFSPDGVPHYDALSEENGSLRKIAAFPSSYLVSPRKWMLEHYKPGTPEGDAIARTWSQGKRYTRYRGLTTSWDMQVDKDVWSTNIDTVFFHKVLEEAGVLSRPKDKVRKVTEIGVGGGHLSSLLAGIFPGAQLSITDISSYALSTTLLNIIARHPLGLEIKDRIKKFWGKGIAALEDGQDLIINNPPYIPAAPFEKGLANDPYRGTGLIRELIKDGYKKLNPDNPEAAIYINISSMADKDVQHYLAEFRDKIEFELVGASLRVPLKIRWMSEEWKRWLVDVNGGLERIENPANDEEEYWHTLQVYRIRRKPEVAQPKRVAIVAGTFDPFHLAHEKLVRDVKEELGVDEVIVVPSHVSPHKQGKLTAPKEVRYEMVKAGVAGIPWAKVSDFEVNRPGPSYTIDLVDHVKAQYAKGSKFFVVVGEDTVEGLDTWKDIERLKTEVGFVAYTRTGKGRFNPRVPVQMIERPAVELSATQIRSRVAVGRSIDGFVSPEVARIMEQQGLYQPEEIFLGNDTPILSLQGQPLKVDKPFVVVTDAHGTLMLSTWKKEYAYAFAKLTGRPFEEGMRWVEARIVQQMVDTTRDVPFDDIVSMLGREVALRSIHKTREEIIRTCKEGRTVYEDVQMSEAMPGAIEALKVFKEMGLPVRVVTGRNSHLVYQQLKQAGFGDLISEVDVFGRDRQEKISPAEGKDYAPRENAVRHIMEGFPGRRLVHLDDWLEGLRVTKDLDGIFAGVPQGTGREQKRNDNRLRAEGADLMIRNAAGWKRMVSLVKVLEARRVEHVKAMVTKNARVAMFQFNPTVGDLDGNFNRLAVGIGKAKSQGVDVLISPEMSLTGYPPEDHLRSSEFVLQNKALVKLLALRTQGITAVVGFADVDRYGRVYNALAVLSGGEVKGIYRKNALPNYGVFDDARTVFPGDGVGLYDLDGNKLNKEVFDLNGLLVAFDICEDMWVEPGGEKEGSVLNIQEPVYNHIAAPYLAQAAKGARLIINTSASPYRTNVQKTRDGLAKKRAKETNATWVYVNTVGGQDEVVYDGNSMVVAPDGMILARAKPFEEDFVVLDIGVQTERWTPQELQAAVPLQKFTADEAKPAIPPVPEIAAPDDIKPLFDAIILGMRDYYRKNRVFKGVVFGNSGGIDSGLMGAMAAYAFGPENVHSASLPTQNNSEGTKGNARELARNLGIGFEEIPIQDAFEAILRTVRGALDFQKATRVTVENIQARLRMIFLMARSNEHSWLLLATSNKSESALGWFTLYGDSSGGFAPFKDLSKTDIFRLARYVNDVIYKRTVIPEDTISRPPSPELEPNQVTATTIPDYRTITDPVLRLLLDENLSAHEVAAALGLPLERIRWFQKRLKFSEWKRKQTGPGIKVSRRAFGRDRRMPITDGYDPAKVAAFIEQQSAGPAVDAAQQVTPEALDKLKKSTRIEEAIRIVVEHYPEMQWLTGKMNTTPEGVSLTGQGESISRRLFGENHVEFNRTAVGIMTLLWVLNDDYDSFTASQDPAVKLTRESFKELKATTERILNNDPQAFDALIAYTVINDLGKVVSVVDLLKKEGRSEEVDHDKILVRVLEKYPEVSPSFNRLSDKYKRLILSGLRAEFNFGQFVQAENVPASLEGLTGLSQEAFDFYMLHVLYDIAGAAGHVREAGSVVVTEPVFQSFRQGIAALEKISQGAGVVQVYDHFLRQKGALYHLDVNKPRERVVIRICTMLRLANDRKVREVMEVFNSLEPNEQAILEKGLNINGVDDGYASLFYYSPATFANLIKALEEAKDPDAFKKAVKAGLRMFARTQQARIALKARQGSGVFVVDVARIAEMAKAPATFENAVIGLEQVGSDAKAEMSSPSVIDLGGFERLAGLDQIPGQRIIPIGIGGGSDVIQAAIAGQLLAKAGKTIPVVISVRSEKTGSQGVADDGGVRRSVQGHGGEIAPGVFRILPVTTGSGRFLENVPAGDIPVFLIVDAGDGALTEKIKAAVQYAGGADTILSVDTGGDALYTTGVEVSAEKATPDQDLRVLRALAETGLSVMTAEIATGVDSPRNAGAVLTKAEARFYQLSDDEKQQALALYQRWGMDGNAESVRQGKFGKTPFAWQMALKGERGWECLPIPERVVLDDKNPWDPFVYLSDSVEGIFFMSLKDHLNAIENATDAAQVDDNTRLLIDFLSDDAVPFWEWPPEEYLGYLNRFAGNHKYPRRSLKDTPLYTDPGVIKFARTPARPDGWAQLDLDAPGLSSAERSAVEEQVRADIMRWAPDTVFENGRPKNNLETGMRGRGKLGNYGKNPAEDPVVLRMAKDGALEVLLIERSDGTGFGFPGGFIARGQENIVGVTATREGIEEALSLSAYGVDLRQGELVYDGKAFSSRDTNDAWIVTRALAGLISYQASQKLQVEAADDAKPGSARWMRVDKDLLTKLVDCHAVILKNAVKAVMSGVIRVNDGLLKSKELLLQEVSVVSDAAMGLAGSGRTVDQVVSAIFGRLDQTYSAPDQEHAFYRRIQKSWEKLDALLGDAPGSFQDAKAFQRSGREPLTTSSLEKLAGMVKEVEQKYPGMLRPVLALLDVGKIEAFRRKPEYQHLNFANHPQAGAAILEQLGVLGELGLGADQQKLALAQVREHGYMGQFKRGEVTNEIFRGILDESIRQKDPDILKLYLTVSVIDTAVVREGLFTEEFFQWFDRKYEELRALAVQAIGQGKTADEILSASADEMLNSPSAKESYALTRLASIWTDRARVDISAAVDKVFVGNGAAKQWFIDLLSKQKGSLSFWYPEIAFSAIDTLEARVVFLALVMGKTASAHMPLDRPLDISFYQIAEEMNRRDEPGLQLGNRVFLVEKLNALTQKYLAGEVLVDALDVPGIRVELDREHHAVYVQFDPLAPAGLDRQALEARMRQIEETIGSVNAKDPIRFIRHAASSGVKNIGVLVASFDPLQRSHLKIIEQAAARDDIDELVIILSKDHILRDSFGEPLASRALIFEQMLKGLKNGDKVSVAISNTGRFMDLPFALEKPFPGAKFDYFMGFDNFEQMLDEGASRNNRAQLGRFLSAHKVTVLPRWYYKSDDVRRVMVERGLTEFLPSVGATMALSREFRFHSATEVKRRLREGLSVSDMVPLAALRIIKAMGWYSQPAEPDLKQVREPVKVSFVNLTSPRHKVLVEPLGVGALAGDLKREFGNDVKLSVIDAQFGTSVQEVLEQLRRAKPAIIALSAQLESHEVLEELLGRLGGEAWIGEGETKVLVGGNLPTNDHRRFLEKFPFIVIVRGEGEIAMRQAVRWARGDITIDELPAASFIRGGKVVENDGTPVSARKLGSPSRDSLVRILDHEGDVQIETSRGCGYGVCAFCFKDPFRAHAWEPFPDEVVLDSLEELYRSGARHVNLSDSEFFGGGKATMPGIRRARSLAEGILKRGLKLSIAFSARVDSIVAESDTPAEAREKIETLKIMRQAGFENAFLGVESGSPEQLKRYRKGASVIENEGAIRVLRELGFTFMVGFIPLDPYVTLEEIVQNMKFLKRNDLFLEVSYPVNPLRVQPKTEYYNWTLRDGLLGQQNDRLYDYESRYKDPQVQKVADTVKQYAEEIGSVFYMIKYMYRTMDLMHLPDQQEELELLKSIFIRYNKLEVDFLQALATNVALPDDFDQVVRHFRLARFNLVNEVKKAIRAGRISDREGFLSQEIAKLDKLMNEVLGMKDPVMDNVPSAENVAKGGIDLDPAMLDLQIKRDNKGVPLPAYQQPLSTMRIEGFSPVIFSIVPVQVEL